MRKIQQEQPVGSALSQEAPRSLSGTVLGPGREVVAPSPTGADLVFVAKPDQNAKRTRRASVFHGSANARQLRLSGATPTRGLREP
jgi:hypothetical protein